ncbi:hypothetical protein KE513_03690 [Oscillospiraceae bacterium Marseille-Q3528]|nr:hypothetical protein [Oscillospiraceae bacterium Marseille-Q3528]
MSTLTIVLLVIALVLTAAFVALYFFTKRMEKKQDAQREQMDAMAQSMSMLIIDKKRMRLKDSGLPQTVIDQSPKILRRSKVPIVKAKIGPRVMTLMCDEAIFDQVPVKKEVKAVVSGIYITAVKGLRGTVDTTEQKKKGFWARTKEKALAARSSKNK